MEGMKTSDSEIQFVSAKKRQAAEDLVECNSTRRLYVLKEFDACVQIYNKALALNPYHARILSYRSECYKNLGRYEESIADVVRSLELNPKVNHFANLRLMNLYLIHGEIELTKDAIKQYNETYPFKGEIEHILETLNKMEALDIELQEELGKKNFESCVAILDLLLEIATESSRYKKLKDECLRGIEQFSKAKADKIIDHNSMDTDDELLMFLSPLGLTRKVHEDEPKRIDAEDVKSKVLTRKFPWEKVHEPYAKKPKIDAATQTTPRCKLTSKIPQFIRKCFLNEEKGTKVSQSKSILKAPIAFNADKTSQGEMNPQAAQSKRSLKRTRTMEIDEEPAVKKPKKESKTVSRVYLRSKIPRLIAGKVNPIEKGTLKASQSEPTLKQSHAVSCAAIRSVTSHEISHARSELSLHSCEAEKKFVSKIPEFYRHKKIVRFQEN